MEKAHDGIVSVNIHPIMFAVLRPYKAKTELYPKDNRPSINGGLQTTMYIS